MKAVFRPALISFAILGLTACASGGGTASVAPAVDPSPGAVVRDVAYINQVERSARSRGIEVQWVNPPTRRIASN